MRLLLYKGMTKDESMNGVQALQRDLAITPKTASLLHKVGYTKFTDLRACSPNQLVSQINSLTTNADVYKRGFRRMVWLATQDDPATCAKRCPTWTQKALEAKGLWREDFDNLTGDGIQEWFEQCGRNNNDL
jgi:hypothetical protein